MLTQDEIDHWCIKGLGTIISMLEDRVQLSQAGLSEKCRKILEAYFRRLVSAYDILMIRKQEQSMHKATLIELDEWFTKGTNNLLVYLHRRINDGPEPSENFKNQLRSFAEHVRELVKIKDQ